MKHVDNQPKLIVTELGQKKRESFDFNWNEVMIRYKQIGKGVAALMQKQIEQEWDKSIKRKSMVKLDQEL